MAGLKDLGLRSAYHKGEDDIARDFYLPAIAESVEYRRAVGFFSSSIYVLAWPSLRRFIESGGRIWLLCSPVLAESDVEALIEGHSQHARDRADSALDAEIRDLLANPQTAKPARVLASLVAHDIMQVRVAFLGATAPAKSRRIFHDKLGLLRDRDDNNIAFKGSMNETFYGLSLDGNLESIDVFVDWGDQREAQRVRNEYEYFTNLWEGRYPNIVSLPFPEVARERLIRAKDEDWQHLVDEICAELETAPSGQEFPIHLWPHQLQALEAWEAAGRRGVLEHATGSGKTLTALAAMRDAIRRHEVPLVLVPSEVLLNQWAEAIRSVLQDLSPAVLVCGGGDVRWRADGRLSLWSGPATTPRVILAMIQTASTPEFISSLRGGNHLFVVGDEVHRLGSPMARSLLTVASGPRLGLSATPERAGDPNGTAAIFDYFGQVLQPRFDLSDAVAAGILAPYMYYVHPVTLLDQEQLEWNRLTTKIARAMSVDVVDDLYLQNLLIARARLVKQAADKIPLAARVVAAQYQRGQKWLVYCDSQAQMSGVTDCLKASGIDASEYYAEMTANKTETLRHFDINGGVIVAIRCLDEGIDIPSASHAVILASSKNPREFIQRRGRVLRQSTGKGLAYIHDAIVIPRSDAARDSASSIVEGELARAIRFGSDAVNPAVIDDLRAIALRFRIDLGKKVKEGSEDDE